MNEFKKGAVYEDRKQTTYTPGPWKCTPPVDEHGHEVIDLFSPEYWIINGPGADVHGYMSSFDARLIAAAPDLLEAMQTMLGDTAESDIMCWNDVVLKARVAIVKAIGETNY